MKDETKKSDFHPSLRQATLRVSTSFTLHMAGYPGLQLAFRGRKIRVIGNFSTIVGMSGFNPRTRRYFRFQIQIKRMEFTAT